MEKYSPQYESESLHDYIESELDKMYTLDAEFEEMQKELLIAADLPQHPTFLLD